MLCQLRIIKSVCCDPLCLGAWGCCLREQCSTYEKLTQHRCFQLPAAPQRTHRPPFEAEKSREKKQQFSCKGLKQCGLSGGIVVWIWKDFSKTLGCYQNNHLVALSPPKSRSGSYQRVKADKMSSDWVCRNKSCILQADRRSHDPHIRYFLINKLMNQLEKSNHKRKL